MHVTEQATGVAALTLVSPCCLPCLRLCGSDKPANSDVLRRLAELWKEADEDERAPFEKQAAKESQIAAAQCA